MQSWPSLTYQETTGQNDCMITVDHGAGSIEVMKCEVICYFMNLGGGTCLFGRLKILVFKCEERKHLENHRIENRRSDV